MLSPAPAARRAATGSLMTRSPDPPAPDEGQPQPIEQLHAPDESPLTPGIQLRPLPQSLALDRLGDFRIDRRLGAGGMGEVFAATHVVTKQRVALKVLRITSSTLLYRFKREFRALADITHPNVAGLHELFVPTDGPAFFSMELIEGRAFTTYVRRGVRERELPDVPRLEAALLQLVRGVHSPKHIHHHVAEALQVALRQPTGEQLPDVLGRRPAEHVTAPELGNPLHDATPLQLGAKLCSHGRIASQAPAWRRLVASSASPRSPRG